jgi:hypothetical protein
MRGRIGGRSLFGIGAVTLAVLAFMVGIAAAAVSNRGGEEFVQVASGRSGGVPWAVGMMGHGGRRCYETSADREGRSEGASTCRREDLTSDWRRVIGNSGDRKQTSLELDLTSARVRTLRLSIHRIGAGTAIRSFHPKLLTTRQSRLSGLPRDFRFVVIVEPREFCVEGVEALAQSGAVVADEAVPCEG